MHMYMHVADALAYDEMPKGVLVGKNELDQILDYERTAQQFLELVRTSQGVICYRAGPHLKAKLAGWCSVISFVCLFFCF
jgi:hypothetical protein